MADAALSPLKPAQAAEALGVSTRTIRRYINSGLLLAYSLPSGHRRIPMTAVEGCLEHGIKRQEAPRPRKSQPSHRPSPAPTLTRRAKLGAEGVTPLFFDTSEDALATLRATCDDLPSAA